MGERQLSAEALGGRLFKEPIKAEVKVQVELPPEAQELLRDLHSDRQSLGIAGGIMLVCTVVMAAKSVYSMLHKKEST